MRRAWLAAALLVCACRTLAHADERVTLQLIQRLPVRHVPPASEWGIRLAGVRSHLVALRQDEALLELGAILSAMERDGAEAEGWFELAELCAETGALSCAEKAAARAGSAAAQDLAADLARRRQRLGLPRDGARYNITPDREPAFADLVCKEDAALRRGNTEPARTEIEQALLRFPEAPGLLGLLCEAQLQLGQRSEAARTCDRALAEQEDFALGHLWAGRAAVDRAGAIRHLRRAIDLAPELPQAWLELETLYRRAHDRRALRALDEERRRMLRRAPGG